MWVIIYNCGVKWGIIPNKQLFMSRAITSFTGEYVNLIDQKKRLSIPSKFRKSLDPSNDKTFVVTKGFDKCLVLYPTIEWSRLEHQLSRLNSIKERHRSFVRSVVRYATYVRYDSQGRIPLPENLLEYANVNKSVNIIGMIKKIELWNPEELNAKDSSYSNSLLDSDFDELSNEIDF